MQGELMKLLMLMGSKGQASPSIFSSGQSNALTGAGMMRPPLPGNPEEERNAWDKLRLLLTGKDYFTDVMPQGGPGPYDPQAPYKGAYAPGAIPREPKNPAGQ